MRADLPSALTRTIRSPDCKIFLRNGASTLRMCGFQRPCTKARYCLCIPPSRSKSCKRRNMLRFFAIIKQPEVSRSKRCTNSK
ncbi:hypothetical protein THIOM_003651 [Candidatus Thiomargarita nelsonii]|uniref:Uncharacterized protein n=1 Tax=Candidatus Thiomargarita nelsonii TaxID=1003181 RepID=A0A176RXZ5_9GAMM|nr:hypothetical protein THIOM_003651 [Candidatus Thiomargarita nelsonii]